MKHSMVYVFCLLMLVACTTTPRAPEVRTVEVPIPVKCIKDAPNRPVYDTESLPVDSTDAAAVSAVAKDWVKSRGYEKQLEISVKACL